MTLMTLVRVMTLTTLVTLTFLPISPSGVVNSWEGFEKVNLAGKNLVL
jgi:hypothetical protein